jgi:hypothetical protein
MCLLQSVGAVCCTKSTRVNTFYADFTIDECPHPHHISPLYPPPSGGGYVFTEMLGEFDSSCCSIFGPLIESSLVFLLFLRVTL